MATCCKLQTVVIFESLAICKPCIRFLWSLYRFRPKSSHLYALIFLSLPEHAYALHIMTCIASCCLCIAPWLIVGPLLVLLLWVEPGDEYVTEEPVEYAYKYQAFDNSENIAGKMTIPSKSLLSLLASCSLYCNAALPTTCYIIASHIAVSSL